MQPNSGLVTRTPPIWIVAGCALIVAVAGSFIAISVAAEHAPENSQSTRITYYNDYSGPEILPVLFGVPIATLVCAAVSYSGLVLNRPRVMGAVAVLAGLVSAYIVGLENQAIASWWLGLSTDTNRVASIISALVTLLTVPVIGLSVKYPILRTSATRRGAVAALLSISVLSGLLVGLWVGGEAAVLTGLQDWCFVPSVNCYGPDLANALSGGELLGMWFGGGMGLVAGAIVWAVPPWSLRKVPAATTNLAS